MKKEKHILKPLGIILIILQVVMAVVTLATGFGENILKFTNLKGIYIVYTLGYFGLAINGILLLIIHSIKNTSFWHDIRLELGKIKWPSKKEMVQYSIATLGFCIFFALFFSLADLLFAFVKGLFN